MEKDIEKTKVIFKIIEDDYGEDVIAIFPEVPWDDKFLSSYQHIGQHGGCHPDLLNLPNATPEEYKDLAHELENLVGYNLEIINP